MAEQLAFQLKCPYLLEKCLGSVIAVGGSWLPLSANTAMMMAQVSGRLELSSLTPPQVSPDSYKNILLNLNSSKLKMSFSSMLIKAEITREVKSSMNEKCDKELVQANM